VRADPDHGGAADILEVKMTLRDILLVTGSDLPVSVPRFAVQLARKYDAHLTGLFVTPPIRLVGVEGGDMILDAIRRQQTEGAAEAQALFEGCVDEAGYQPLSEWRAEVGDPVEIARRLARHADLAVVSQGPEDGYDALSGARPEDLLFGSGRPVLVVPRYGRFDSIGEHVLIAWNGSPEAARAVHDAFPFLDRAAKITILTVNPGSELPEKWSEEEIARHLARHGFEITINRESSNELDAGDLLLNFAADNGADLLVMGGYGHSRLREFVFGGATRAILDSATLPVLMSH
jgi:nucleotide-binding universal stress UspA family protein